MPNDTATPNDANDNRSYMNWNEVKKLTWKFCNFATIVTATTMATALVHNPLNAFMYSRMNKIPFSNVRLWDGLAAYSLATMVRTTYLSNVKSADKTKSSGEKSEIVASPEEFNFLQKSMTSYERAYYFALGELISVQASEALSQIRKLPAKSLENFVWHTKYNFYKLNVTTAGARFSFGYIGFTSLFNLEPYYASRLNIDNPVLKHFLAGGISGCWAAFFSFPFDYYRFYRLAKVTIVNGNILVPSILETIKLMIHDLKDISLGRFILEQVFTRMSRTGTRYGIAVGMTKLCGPEPLSYFFSQAPDMRLTTSGTSENEPKLKK